jgi:hypothetical protein
MNTLTQPRRGNKAAGDNDNKADAKDQKSGDQKQDQKQDAKADAGDTSMTKEQVTELIGKSIADGFAKFTPKDQPISLDAVKGLIEAQFEKFKQDSKDVTKDNLQDFANSVIEKGFDNVRRDKKNLNDPADAEGTRGTGDNGQPDPGQKRGPSGDRLDIPISWTKGNLPLHGKQLLNLCQHKSLDDGIPESMLAKGKALGDRSISGLISKAVSLQKYGGKAMTSTGANTGDEFVPTDLSAELLRRFFLSSDLAAVMAAREVKMPTEPYVYPLSTTRPQFYGESTENTAATTSDPGTDKTTLSSVRFVGETDFSYELDEDSIIAMLPTLQMLLAEGAADAWEDALINGDTTGTHQDTDTAAGSAKLPAKFVKGFRKLALAISGLKTDLSSGGVGTNANFLAVRKLLKKYGGNPKNLIWLASPTTAIAMQGIAETVSLEKFGSRATIVTGEIAALQGIPIIQSERVREDVDATGVNGASGNTKATVQIVNITRFLTGFRRQLMVEVWKDIKKGQNVVVASFRKAFTPLEVPSATITSVGIGYNFTP